MRRTRRIETSIDTALHAMPHHPSAVRQILPGPFDIFVGGCLAEGITLRARRFPGSGDPMILEADVLPLDVLPHQKMRDDPLPFKKDAGLHF